MSFRDLLWSLVMLGIIEALIKPIAKRLVQRKLLTVLPLLYQALDPLMPHLLRVCSAEQLDQVVRDRLQMLTGEDWSTRNIEPFYRLYDLRINAGRVDG